MKNYSFILLTDKYYPLVPCEVWAPEEAYVDYGPISGIRASSAKLAVQKFVKRYNVQDPGAYFVTGKGVIVLSARDADVGGHFFAHINSFEKWGAPCFR